MVRNSKPLGGVAAPRGLQDFEPGFCRWQAAVTASTSPRDKEISQ